MIDQDKILKIADSLTEAQIRDELSKRFNSKKQRLFSKVISAALGSVPWVGGFISTYTAYKDEKDNIKNNELYQQWIQEHSRKMELLGQTLLSVLQRLDEFPENINERLESENYLDLVRKSFRSWDSADTDEKRQLIRKLLTNAGADTLVPDDLVRLFLDWINQYHEIHFKVIKVIYRKKGVTRYGIWKDIHGEIPREDSAEADLFRLMIHDLSTGRVIRQHRPVDYSGRFLKKSPSKTNSSSNVMKSAFDNEEPYELTELGKYFVHYTMDDVVPRIGKS